MTVQVSKKTKPCKKQYMFCWLPTRSLKILFLFFAAKTCVEQKIFVEVQVGACAEGLLPALESRRAEVVRQSSIFYCPSLHERVPVSVV